MRTLMISDQKVRDAAIDPTRSFIIQAPAGSGKTELLAQRYLNLLAEAARNPEEIIAITFTRKAAAEMRERIMSALEFASQNPEPQENYKKTTWHLAQKVLKADNQHQWQLLSNPNRLRILTIDALSAMISLQIPLLSGFGGKPSIIDNAQMCYRQSIIEILDRPQHLHTAVQTLLLHLDNNAELLTDLLMQLLQKREQWLPHIMSHYQQIDELKNLLEQSLQNLISDILWEVDAAIPENTKKIIISLANFAAQQLETINPQHILCNCKNVTTFPDPTSEKLPQWQAIAELLLTKQFEWRKSLDKRIGFLPEHKKQKQQLLTLIQELQTKTELQSALTNIILCPPSTYTENQWEMIRSLMELLPHLTAELHIQFQKSNVIDFVELTLGALRALGNEDQPTDLALYLDYQFQHMLVDEFQDTSVMQFQLLQRLVQEWQPDEGKTLFLVGDPMQSIYRFRNAEVGLFLQTQQKGIANIKLTALSLTQNFRSEMLLVEWFNQTFTHIFPKKMNIHSGAVSYSPSCAEHKESLQSNITYHAVPITNTQSSAQSIVKRIQQIQQQDPNDSIAILVRSRTHLLEIITELNHQNLSYQAIELETLNHRPEIIDLVSLTRALLHLGDRIAWLSLLRAPWCGLTLIDLHAICQKAQDRPLWAVLANDQQDLASVLSLDAKMRLQRIMPQLIQSIHAQGRYSLSEWIKGTWLGLSGPACLHCAAEWNNVQSYFALLEEIQYEFSFDLLERKLENLYAKTETNQHTQLQLMTIHKSKGLEFDHVIIPELQKCAPHETNSLLMWLEYPNIYGDTDLLLAPIKAQSENLDPIHRYLKQLENKKLEFEIARLFYVAVTRAKKSLHFYTKLNIDTQTGEYQEPSKNTFLALLWPLYKNQLLDSILKDSESSTITIANHPLTLERLPHRWPIPYPLTELPALNDFSVLPQEDNFYEQYIKSLLGTLIHEALQHLADKPNIDFVHHEAYWQRRLLQSGVATSIIPALFSLIKQAVNNTLSDARGLWIIKPHREAKNEYSLTTHHNNKFQKYIIDRCFIDENDTRWIIDYKSATPTSEAHLTEFLDQQKAHHQEQLNRYAQIMALSEIRPIKLGLYFPLCQGWIEWLFNDDVSNHDKEPFDCSLSKSETLI